MREERRLRVFENRVLRRVFGPKRDDVRREWIKLNNVSLIICIPHQIPYRSGDKIEKNEPGGACSTYGRGETYTGFWRENLRKRTTWKIQA